MSFRSSILASLFCVGAFGAEQNPFVTYNQGAILSSADAVSIESALAANPEDLNNRIKLLAFYAAPSGNDPEWTNRYRLLSWVVERHPESNAAGIPQIWRGIPAPVFEQLKPAWVAQVHQHADDARVLNNAAAFFESKGSSAMLPSSVRVGAKVQEANLVHSVDPVYPPLAMQARIQGTVRFNVTIGTDGHIENAQLISGHPLLVESAQQAVQQYLYRPTLLNGKPVSVITTVDVNFALSNAGAWAPR